MTVYSFSFVFSNTIDLTTTISKLDKVFEKKTKEIKHLNCYLVVLKDFVLVLYCTS